MARTTPEAKVGLLVLAGLLLLIFMSLRLGNFEFGSGGGYQLELVLPNAEGLGVDSNVSMAGIPIGIVEKIDLLNGQAKITMRLKEDAIIPADSSASLRTKGVLGEKFISLIPGTSSAALANGDRIRAGAPPGDLDRLVGSLNEVSQDIKLVSRRLANVLGTKEGEDKLRKTLDDLQGTATGLRKVVEENQENLRTALYNISVLSADLQNLVSANSDNLTVSISEIKQLASNLNEIVAENRQPLREGIANIGDAGRKLGETLDAVEGLVTQLGDSEGTLGKLINDDSLYEELTSASRSLNAVMTKIDSGEGTLGKLVNDDGAYARLEQSLENIEEITGKIESGEGTVGKLVNDQELHDNLNEAVENINDFITESDRFSFRLSYRAERLVELGDTKHYFGLTLQPRQDRFYLFELVDDPNGNSSDKTVVTTIDSSTTGTEVRTIEETETDDELKFSVQVGKRFSFLTLRGGIIESSGGLGADVDLWNNRLRLSLDAFDFSRDDDRPVHLKLSARWLIWNHLMITAGLDDFLDDTGGADYFIGAGVTFIDDDLRFLFSPATSLIN